VSGRKLSFSVHGFSDRKGEESAAYTQTTRTYHDKR